MSFTYPPRAPHAAANLRPSVSTMNKAPARKETSTEFSFHATDEPGVWRVRTERGEEFVRHPDRAVGYVLSACLVNNCPNPIKDDQ